MLTYADAYVDVYTGSESSWLRIKEGDERGELLEKGKRMLTFADVC